MRSGPISPAEAKILGPVLTETLTFFRRPIMPANTAYALLPDLSPLAKPFGYGSLKALARRIHRDRKGHALQLLPTQITFRDRKRDVTEIFATDPGGRVRRIGFAWIAGKDWRVLEAALHELQPPAPIAEAA